MWIKKGSLLIVLVFLICGFFTQCVCESVVVTSDASEGYVVDIFTQKLLFNGIGFNRTSDAFGPHEEVVLYAQVRENETWLEDTIVTFVVDGPRNSVYNISWIRTASTNSNGIAEVSFVIPLPSEDFDVQVFGTWRAAASIEVENETVEDMLSFKVGWVVETTSVRTVDNNTQATTIFGIEGDVGVEITLKNIAYTRKTAAIYIVFLDELNQTVDAVEILNFEVQPNETSVRFYSKLYAPRWASVGNATVYVNVLNAPSSLGGTAYCPEKSVNFLLLASVEPVNIVLRDLSVVYVSLSSNRVALGSMAEVYVGARNEGTETETLTVKAYYEDVLINMASIEGIESYSQVTLNFLWNTSDLPEGEYLIKAEVDLVPEEVEETDNTLFDGIIVIGQPVIHDVAVVNVTTLTESVYAGETVDISVEVRNEGETFETFDVELYGDSHLIEAKFASLQPSEGKTLPFMWNTSGMAPGNYTIHAYASPVAGETDLDDNSFVNGVIEVKVFLPVYDVAIRSVTLSTNEVSTGDVVNITVTIENEGHETVSCNVSTFFDAILIGEKGVTNLQPRETQLVNFSWNTSDVPEGSYVVSAYATPVSGEADFSDNVFVDGSVLVRDRISQPSSQVGDSTFLLVAIFVIPRALLLPLILLLLKRRRKRKDAIIKS